MLHFYERINDADDDDDEVDVLVTDRANSVTWNPHKLMGVELQCSAILVREKVRSFS